ncbi:TetR/AcrR family transcriptional regulator [Nocardioides sp.]|uniref:TetR/AcrR family transcriptional regulator n=1 Tax=Nocardioides sp. TaxID=35761 RepID=UPI003517D00F
MGAQDYFDVTMDLLAAEGYPALKQQRLCQALGVTTGSFYTHFGSWQDFTGRFLEHWTEQRTLQIAELADQAEDPIAALTLLRERALSTPHRSEAAIRAWSLADPTVAATQARVDRLREEAIFRAMSKMFDDAEEARHFARMAMFTLVGFEQIEANDARPEHLDAVLQRILVAVVEASGWTTEAVRSR